MTKIVLGIIVFGLLLGGLTIRWNNREKTIPNNWWQYNRIEREAQHVDELPEGIACMYGPWNDQYNFAVAIYSFNQADAFSCTILNWHDNWTLGGIGNWLIEQAMIATRNKIKQLWDDYMDYLKEKWRLPETILAGQEYDKILGNIKIGNTQVLVDTLTRETFKYLKQESQGKIFSVFQDGKDITKSLFNPSKILTNVSQDKNILKLADEIWHDMNNYTKKTPVPPTSINVASTTPEKALNHAVRYAALKQNTIDTKKLLARTDDSRAGYTLQQALKVNASQNLLAQTILQVASDNEYAANIAKQMDSLSVDDSRHYQAAVKEMTRLLQTNNILMAKLLKALAQRNLLEVDSMNKELQQEIIDFKTKQY